MSRIFPETMPVPAPTMDDAAFWEACAARRLLFQACGTCGALRHPPTPLCPACQSTLIAWIEAPSEAEVYTYTVIHHASHPAVVHRTPYVGAVIVFPTLPGVRLVSNVTDCPPTAVRIGMEVRLWWDDVGDGQWVPRFRPPPGETLA